MSFLSRLKGLFTTDATSAPEPTPPPAAPRVRPQPARPIPGWSGPDVEDHALATLVVRLMEQVCAPGFTQAAFAAPDFTEGLATLEAARAYPDLVEILRRTLIALRDHMPAVHRLARVYADLWDTPSAEALFRRMVDANYHPAEANFFLGELAEREERLTEAAAYYQRAVAEDVHFANAWQRAERLKDHLPMPRRAAAVTVGGVGGAAEAQVGVRPPEGFELRHPLGRGGYGTVYLARDTRLHRDVAIKFLHPHLTQDARRAEAFFNEARLAARLALPGVVRIYDLNPDDRLIVMEYLTRGTLRDRLAAGRPLAPRAALRVAASLLKTLALLHARGLVHRDIKPENLLFRSDGATVLGDFGVAALEADALEARAAGTLAYMAPEQRAAGGHGVDRRADLYALGLILAEMLAGVVPQSLGEGVQPAETWISLVPARWRTLFAPTLRRLLAADPDQRANDAHRVYRELLEIRKQLVTREQGRELLEDLERLADLGDGGPEATAFLAMVRRELRGG